MKEEIANTSTLNAGHAASRGTSRRLPTAAERDLLEFITPYERAMDPNEFLAYLRKKRLSWDRFILSIAESVGLVVFPGGDVRENIRPLAAPCFGTTVSSPTLPGAETMIGGYSEGTQDLKCFNQPHKSFSHLCLKVVSIIQFFPSSNWMLLIYRRSFVSDFRIHSGGVRITVATEPLNPSVTPLHQQRYAENTSGIIAAITACIQAAGGSVTSYPSNTAGIIQALIDLQTALTTGGTALSLSRLWRQQLLVKRSLWAMLFTSSPLTVVSGR